MTAVGTIAEVIGAVAAVGALGTGIVAARRAGQAVQETRGARVDSRTAHAEDMDDRASAFNRDLVLQRLTQLDRISNIVRELADVARREINEPAPSTAIAGVRLSPIPGIATHLDVAIMGYRSLGGGDLAELSEFSRQAKWATADRTSILGDALMELGKLDAATRAESMLLEAGFGAAVERAKRRSEPPVI